jgi:cobalt-zinc-cadmium efflux system outer membrane protein
LQAGLLPNPELEIEVEDVAGTGGGNAGVEAAETTIALGQLVELGGKRAARMRLATAEGRLAGWDYEAERLAVLIGTALAFVDVLAAKEQLRLAEDLRTLTEQTFKTVTERVKAGKVSPLEKTKAGVELASSKIELAKAQSELRSARTRLAAMWGDVAPRFTEVAGSLESIAEPPSLRAIQAVLHRNPEIARWAQEMEQRLAALAVEKAARVPDLTVGFGVKRSEENDDYALVLGVGIPLQVFDRNQGGIREARYRLAQMQHEKRGAEVRAASALTGSYEVLRIARAEALSLKSDVVPAAVQAFEAAREGYRLGRFGYLDVLDAQRTLFESRAGLIDALARYHRAVAVVESLIGTPLDSLDNDSGTNKED